jgi:hypothetical protein
MMLAIFFSLKGISFARARVMARWGVGGRKFGGWVIKPPLLTQVKSDRKLAAEFRGAAGVR